MRFAFHSPYFFLIHSTWNTTISILISKLALLNYPYTKDSILNDMQTTSHIFKQISQKPIAKGILSGHPVCKPSFNKNAFSHMYSTSLSLRRFCLLVASNIGFPGGADGKQSTCNAGNLGSTLGQEDSLEKGMATQSSILA